MKYIRTISNYLILSLIALAFGAIYEKFSHDVYSMFMVYAFVIPLVLGAAVYMILLRFRMPFPNMISESLYTSGITTLLIGSIVKGVFEIYGTESPMLRIFFITGLAFCSLGILLYIGLVWIVAPRQVKKGACE